MVKRRTYFRKKYNVKQIGKINKESSSEITLTPIFQIRRSADNKPTVVVEYREIPKELNKQDEIVVKNIIKTNIKPSSGTPKLEAKFSVTKQEGLSKEVIISKIADMLGNQYDFDQIVYRKKRMRRGNSSALNLRDQKEIGLSGNPTGGRSRLSGKPTGGRTDLSGIPTGGRKNIKISIKTDGLVGKPTGGRKDN